VTLAGIAASIQSSSSTQVVVIVARSATGLVGAVTLNAVSGAKVERLGGWTYVAPASIVTVTPSLGQVGTRVTVAGTALLAGGQSIASASLAGAAVESIVSASDTAVVLITGGQGADVQGDVLFVINTGARVYTSSGTAWTYSVASQVVTVTPNSGQLGTRVTIAGARLLGGGSSVSSVTLAGVAATVVSGTDSTIVLTVAAGAAAVTGHVVVTSDTGARAVLDNSWQYVAPAVVTSVQPRTGQLNTLITVAGTGLLGGGASVASALIGATAAVVVSSSDIAVVLRVATAAAGAAVIMLTADSGAQVTATGFFTQLADGVIVTVAPSSGMLGTRVTLTGSRLLAGGGAAVSVTLGGEAATLVSRRTRR